MFPRPIKTKWATSARAALKNFELRKQTLGTGFSMPPATDYFLL
jgi:hypothetical protein